MGYLFFIPLFILTFISSAEAVYRDLPKEECQIVLLPEEKEVSRWDIVKRATSKIDARDFVKGVFKSSYDSTLSLNSKAILEVKQISNKEKKLEIPELGYNNITLSLSDEKSITDCLQELPEDLAVELIQKEGSIKGKLTGKPGQARFLLHERNGRFYQLSLDWRKFSKISIPADLILSENLYQFIENKNNSKFFYGRKVVAYQDFGDSFIQKLLLPLIAQGQAIRIKTYDGKIVEGKLISKKTQPQILDANQVKVGFSWSGIKELEIYEQFALPRYEKRDLTNNKSILSVENHDSVNVISEEISISQIPDAKLHSMVSIDIGLEKPLVGFLLKSSPLTLMTIDSKGRSIDVVLDAQNIKGARKGWAVDNRLIQLDEVAIENHGYGKIIEIKDDKSIVLLKGDIKLTVSGEETSKLSILPLNSVVVDFFKSFGTFSLSPKFDMSSTISYSEGIYPFTETFGSVAILEMDFLNPGINNSFQVYGDFSKQSHLLEKDRIYKENRYSILFQNFSLKNSEAFDLLKKVTKVLRGKHYKGSYNLIKNENDSFSLSIWIDNLHRYSSLEEISENLKKEFPILEDKKDSSK